jgi:hypothetical protein
MTTDRQVGSGGGAARWNGTRWTRLPLVLPNPGADHLYGVSCVSARRCLAAGDVPFRWNGQR